MSDIPTGVAALEGVGPLADREEPQGGRGHLTVSCDQTKHETTSSFLRSCEGHRVRFHFTHPKHSVESRMLGLIPTKLISTKTCLVVNFRSSLLIHISHNSRPGISALKGGFPQTFVTY
jgi:hypothetical protein